MIYRGPYSTFNGETFVGQLQAKELKLLLDQFREARLNKAQIEHEAIKQGGKLSALLDTHGYFWWHFYEVPLARCNAMLAIKLGWSEDIKRISKSDNPNKAFVDFIRAADHDAHNPIEEMPPAEQALVVNLLLATLYNLQAIGFYSLSINELLVKAANGDQVALKHAIGVDKTVAATSIASTMIAKAQLSRDKKFLSGLWKRPHSGRGLNTDLRSIHRVLDETQALAESSGEGLLALCGEYLQLCETQRGDPLKALLSRFRDWEKDSQPAKSADSSGSSPPI